ncbi:MAG: hypothetical protein IPI96_15645 [Saprospiraceae bacterium]|nr:hypothetical protein [Saprospiraceae bacterium]
MSYKETIKCLKELSHDYYTIYRCITMEHTNADIGISSIKHAIETNKSKIPDDLSEYVRLIEFALDQLNQWDNSRQIKRNDAAILYLDAIQHNIECKILPILEEKNTP